MAKIHRCPTTSTSFCFVAGGELDHGLPLGPVADYEQNPGSATTELVRCLGLRDFGS